MRALRLSDRLEKVSIISLDNSFTMLFLKIQGVPQQCCGHTRLFIVMLKNSCRRFASGFQTKWSCSSYFREQGLSLSNNLTDEIRKGFFENSQAPARQRHGTSALSRATLRQVSFSGLKAHSRAKLGLAEPRLTRKDYTQQNYGCAENNDGFYAKSPVAK